MTAVMVGQLTASMKHSNLYNNLFDQMCTTTHIFTRSEYFRCNCTYTLCDIFILLLGNDH